MGQEIAHSHFNAQDFVRYRERLTQETRLLAEWISQRRMSCRGPVAGFEVEAWLIDRSLKPSPINGKFLEKMASSMVSRELALFNVELNNHPKLLMGHALSELESDLRKTWSHACQVADDLDGYLMTIGILPTLKDTHLNLRFMSPLKRYRALNEQVLRSRRWQPLTLNIVGKQRLRSVHSNVMLESAATSFQIHMQAPCGHAHQIYNAAIAASAPMMAACANSPYLFTHDLWDETRIPLFEQSVEIGGYDGVAHGPLRRVSFGSGYAHHSIIECFEENLRHYPVLLPMLFENDLETLPHLRLHNGTIWRWNRPLIGFDDDGTPHVRIEHRVLPGSPSIVDAIANAALFYGLCDSLRMDTEQLITQLPFDQAKDNFYQAARFGLKAKITWFGQQKIPIRKLLLDELLPQAHRGLLRLGIEGRDCDHYLGIVAERLERSQNGSNWQRRYVQSHGVDMHKLTAAYLEHQQQEKPIHEWPI